MKHLTFTFIFLFTFYYSKSQTDLPNRGLEDWTVVHTTFSGDYDEPTGGVWTTANKVVQLGFPKSTFKRF